MDATEADADWIRAARLQKKADEGDLEAARELEIMCNTPMYEMTGLGQAIGEILNEAKKKTQEQSLLEMEKADWHDRRMTWEEWQEIVRKESTASGKRKFWFSIHSLRFSEVVTQHPTGVPIGV